MKTIKYLVAFATALVMSALSASAYDALGTELNGGTNNVAAATTNSTVNVLMSVPRSPYIAPQVSFKLTGAGTSAVVFKFDESVDAVTWAPSTFSISVTAAGTTAVSGISRQVAGAVGYFRLRIIENPNATAVTNLTLNYSQKN